MITIDMESAGKGEVEDSLEFLIAQILEEMR